MLGMETPPSCWSVEPKRLLPNKTGCRLACSRLPDGKDPIVKTLHGLEAGLGGGVKLELTWKIPEDQLS